MYAYTYTGTVTVKSQLTGLQLSGLCDNFGTFQPFRLFAVALASLDKIAM